MALFGASQGGIAQAAPPVLGCGAVITANTTLHNDIGPCTGDGITITAANVRLNMNGHTVFSSLGVGSQATGTQNVGIHLMNVSGATVLNGEVHGFAAGVRVDGGASNMVKSLYLHDNIGPAGGDLNGDGISAWNSSNNTFDSNLLVHNGPFSGIALVTGPYNVVTDPAITATGNVIKNNLVFNSNVSVCNTAAGCQPRDPNTGLPITMPAPPTVPPTVPPPPPVPFRVPKGALTTSTLDAGIRIEGPNETNTVVDHNVAKDSGIDGIFVMASCHNAFMAQTTPPTPTCVGDVGDTGSIIKNNQSDHNGYGRGQGAGIDLWSMQGLPNVHPSTYSTVTGNSARYNHDDGVTLYSTCGPTDDPKLCATNHNDVVSNSLTDNGFNGIDVQNGSANNAIVQNDVSHNLNTPSGSVATPDPIKAGLLVEEGATDNLLFMNHGTGNPKWDGADMNGANAAGAPAPTPTSPACDSNRWQHNRFGTVNQPCVRTHTWPTGPAPGPHGSAQAGGSAANLARAGGS